MTTGIRTHFDRYKELKETYKIRRSAHGLTNDQFNEYDVVVECCGHGYAHTKYRVLRNAPGLSTLDLAVICDDGNLCFGYRSEGSIICVYTD